MPNDESCSDHDDSVAAIDHRFESNQCDSAAGLVSMESEATRTRSTCSVTYSNFEVTTQEREKGRTPGPTSSGNTAHCQCREKKEKNLTYAYGISATALFRVASAGTTTTASGWQDSTTRLELAAKQNPPMKQEKLQAPRRGVRGNWGAQCSQCTHCTGGSATGSGS